MAVFVIFDGLDFKNSHQFVQKFGWNFVDIVNSLRYNRSCVDERQGNNAKTIASSGCGSAWLERLVWDQEVAGSNPVTPTAERQ